MLDLLFAALVLRALVVSLRRRRFALSVCALGSALAYAMLVADGIAARLFDDLGMMGMLLMVGVGPTSLLGPSARVPLSDVFAPHPVLSKVIIAAGPLAICFWLLRRARSRPLAERSQRDLEIALPFLAVGLAALAVPLVAGLATLLEVPV